MSVPPTFRLGAKHLDRVRVRLSKSRIKSLLNPFVTQWDPSE